MNIEIKIFCYATAIYFMFVCCVCLDNGLGKVPPMGWNSWNKYGCHINQQIIRKNADLLVSSGLNQFGYQYINVDDCWQDEQRDPSGKLKWNSAFPSGIPSLVKYVHQKGLKFGIYSDVGEKTCTGRPGSYQYQDIDAKTFAMWEVDYLKYDNCYNKSVSGKLRYPVMSKALNQTGRKIFFSMCSQGKQQPYRWAVDYVNSWRTASDINDKWTSFERILDQQAGLSKYAGPGGWNDPGMLEVGNGGMSQNQYYAHFAMWCLLKAPLLIGTDLQAMTQNTFQVLRHQGLISINQDYLGAQAQRISHEVYSDGSQDIWAGPLSNNRFVVAFLNRRANQSSLMTVSLKYDLKFPCSIFRLRDIINRKDLGTIAGQDKIQVSKIISHSILVYTIECYTNQNLLQQ